MKKEKVKEKKRITKKKSDKKSLEKSKTKKEEKKEITRKKKEEKPKKSDDELILKLEALLFSTAKPLTIDQISIMFQEKKNQIKKELNRLKEEYEERRTALKIIETGSGWQMNVKDNYIPVIKEVVVDTELSKPVLDTLAIIAYKHPKIKQSEVVNARGSVAYEHIKELLKKGFITREKKGNSFLIKLTPKFFEYFDVDSDKEVKAAFKSVVGEEQLKLDNVVVVEEEPEKKDEEAIFNRELKEPVIDEEKAKEEREYLEEFEKRLQEALKEDVEITEKPLNLEENNEEKRSEEEDDKELKKENEEPIPDLEL